MGFGGKWVRERGGRRGEWGWFPVRAGIGKKRRLRGVGKKVPFALRGGVVS